MPQQEEKKWRKARIDANGLEAMKLGKVNLGRVFLPALLFSCSPSPQDLPPQPRSNAPPSEQPIEIDENALWRGSDGHLGNFSDPDAFGVLEQVEHAVWALSGGESDDAKGLLRSAAAKIAEVRERPGQGDLWSISATAQLVSKAPEGMREIRLLRSKALQALKSGDLPGARETLSKLVSELQVTTTKVSLRRWAATIEKAEDLLAAGKSEETTDAIADGFGEVRDDSGTTPMPLALAEHELALTRGCSDVGAFRSRLESASFQPERAEALGYTGPGTGYRELKGEIRPAERRARVPQFRPEDASPSLRPNAAPASHSQSINWQPLAEVFGQAKGAIAHRYRS